MTGGMLLHPDLMSLDECNGLPQRRGTSGSQATLHMQHVVQAINLHQMTCLTKGSSLQSRRGCRCLQHSPIRADLQGCQCAPHVQRPSDGGSHGQGTHCAICKRSDLRGPHGPCSILQGRSCPLLSRHTVMNMREGGAIQGLRSRLDTACCTLFMLPARPAGPAVHPAQHQDWWLPRDMQLLCSEQQLEQGDETQGREAHGPGCSL